MANSRQLDWFKESESELRPYLIAKNDAYNTWLSSSKREDLTRFRQASYRARKAIRNAKNEWFKAKAMQIEEKRFGGKEVWKNIRDLQHGRRGHLPTRVINTFDEDRNPCITSKDQQERWRRHFTSVLNIRSGYDDSEVHNIRQRCVDGSLGQVPTLQEVAEVVSKLKN